MYRSALMLGLAQFLLMASVAVGLSFSGLVGAGMAPVPALATLPFLCGTLSTALLSLVLPRWFNRWGYRRGFMAGACCGLVGGLVCSWGLWRESFALFCLGCVLAGAYQASALYYRFAAAEGLADARKSQAIAWVLSGGILAAFFGPMLGTLGLTLTPGTYLGAYLLAALLILPALLLFSRLRFPPRQAGSVTSVVRLSLRQLLVHPVWQPAVLLCAGGYAVMMFVMLASPLAMNHCGYSAGQTASVIQWHLLGMFAPSLATGKAIARYGARPLALMGCGILAAGCALALAGEALWMFHVALLLVGLGWNFMYMGGSTLLAQVPDAGVRSRLQAANEFTTYAVMTFTAGGTGWFFHHVGWPWVLGLSLVILLLVALLVVRSAKCPAVADLA